MTPFKAIHGCDPPLLLKGTTTPSRGEVWIGCKYKEMKYWRNWKQINLRKEQDQNQVQTNKHRLDVVYQVGDWIFLKLQPYWLRSLAGRPNKKISPRLCRPYQIVEHIGQAAGSWTYLYSSFHVSLLKPVVQPATSSQMPPPMLSEDYSWSDSRTIGGHSK